MYLAVWKEIISLLETSIVPPRLNLATALSFSPSSTLRTSNGFLKVLTLSASSRRVSDLLNTALIMVGLSKILALSFSETFKRPSLKLPICESPMPSPSGTKLLILVLGSARTPYPNFFAIVCTCYLLFCVKIR